MPGKKQTNQNIPSIDKDGRTTNHKTETHLRKMLTDVKDSLGTPRDKEMLLKVLTGWVGAQAIISELRGKRGAGA